MEKERSTGASDASDHGGAARAAETANDAQATRSTGTNPRVRTFHLYRYDPDSGRAPVMQVLKIELDSSDRMLLDALMKLKALDPSLSFRRSCREGICGSDGMNINGRNGD